LVARVAMAVVIAALTVVASALPALAQEPHENPDTAPWVFDGVSVLEKYSEALDEVLERDAAGVQTLAGQAYWANIPADLKDTIGRFHASSYTLALLIGGIEADQQTSRTMLAQFRVAEAAASSASASQKLAQAYSELHEAEIAALRTARWWRADAAAEGSALRAAHEEVQAKLLQLRRLLDLLSEVHRSLTQQVEIVTAVSKGDVDKLAELKGLLGQSGIPEAVLKQLLEAKGRILRPTALTLSVEPETAFVGDEVSYRGALSSQGEALPGRKVTILLDGSPAAAVVTDGTGAYQGRLALPYHYVSEMTLQAIYYPQGGDIGLYLGCSSAEVVINVLYYHAALSLEVPGSAYPGRDLQLRGSLAYRDSPVPLERSLLVYWDGELAAEKMVSGAFDFGIGMAPDTSPGKHRLMLYVPPHERYGPARASAEVEVVKALPIIDLDAPGIVLLPFSLDVRGRVYSDVGPLQDASLEITLGEWRTTARSGDDGTFSAQLRTGMSLTLVGSQTLRVSATPSEPWHRTGSSATNLLLISPINIAGLVLALVLSLYFGVYRMKRRRLRAPVAPPQPTPIPLRSEEPVLQAEPAQTEPRGSPGAILIALYRAVLRLVQRLTAVVLRPSHTLREFVQECAPALGPLTGYFQDFTLMVERLLYSQYKPTEKDVEDGRQLSDRIEAAGKLRETVEPLPARETREGIGKAGTLEPGGRASTISSRRQAGLWLWVLLILAVAYYACVLLFILPLMIR
jgi:hypothetical protein